MEKEQIIAAVNAARAGKKRNFTQSFDLAISLKHLDMKKPENAINTELKLPHGRGKEIKFVIIADGDMLEKARATSAQVLTKEELEVYGKDRKKAKKLADNVDFFIVQANLMQNLAKSIGPVLGPRKKMPKPSQILPPKGDPSSVMENLKHIIRVATKNQPVLHALVGSEAQSDDEVAENIQVVLNYLEHKLPNPKHNIGHICLKKTMGPSIRIGEEMEGEPMMKRHSRKLARKQTESKPVEKVEKKVEKPEVKEDVVEETPVEETESSEEAN